MHAIGLTNYGDPEVLHLVDLPDPHPTPGQVRVKVRTAGVNPVDALVRDGSLARLFKDAPTPFVPGMDIAGVVDKIGEGVGGIAIGQAVVGVVNNHGGYGGYSQFVCLPSASVIPVPTGASFPEAASFLMNALTARNALDALRLPPGASVLVTGAAGAVGVYAVALARAEGLRVVALAAPADEAELRAAGTTEFVARGDDATARVRRLFPDGVDAVVDAADLRGQIVPAVRDDGTIIILRHGDVHGLERGIRAVFVNVRDRATDHAAIVRLGQHVSDGLLPLRVAAIFPAAEAAAAHTRLAQGGLRGRLVLDFDGMK